MVGSFVLQCWVEAFGPAGSMPHMPSGRGSTLSTLQQCFAAQPSPCPQPTGFGNLMAVSRVSLGLVFEGWWLTFGEGGK